MLQINGKTFMNLQEAVQWLLDNNALPFQSSANYVANTEIGMGTIVNPSPAKVRIGSLIFFADSKVSTVIGLTENGFICSDQYNDLVDDIVYVSNVALNASGHLITTLSNGQTIDAGQIKQVSSFSIDGSQHLIANYNDGTSTDLGAIFTGNINVNGSITANSIIENMVGYSFSKHSRVTQNGLTISYAGVVKNGNKITFVIAGTFKYTVGMDYSPTVGYFVMPSAVYNKLVPDNLGLLGTKAIPFMKTGTAGEMFFSNTQQSEPNVISVALRNIYSVSDQDATYSWRYEETYLLSENLAS